MKSPNFDNVKDFRSFTELSVDIDTDDSVFLTGLNDNGLHIGWVSSKEKAITVLKLMHDLFSIDGAIERNICILLDRFSVANPNPTTSSSVAIDLNTHILHEAYKVSDINNIVAESTQYFMNRFNNLFPQNRINTIIYEINNLIKFINEDDKEPDDLTEHQVLLKSMFVGVKHLTESKIEDIIRYGSDDTCKKALHSLNGLFYAYNNK